MTISEERARHEAAAKREARRLQLVTDYEGMYPHGQLEDMTYAQIVCLLNAGLLDRPTLPPV